MHSSYSAYVFRQVDSVKVLLFSLEFNVVVNQIKRRQVSVAMRFRIKGIWSKPGFPEITLSLLISMFRFLIHLYICFHVAGTF